MKLSINARYRTRTVTGVERYALEVSSRLQTAVEYLEPQRPIAGLRGHWWEQAVLPWRFRGDVLWSPCNTGPLAVRKQVLTLHDCAFWDHPECFTRLFAAWYKWLLPRLVRRVAKVLTVSEYSKRRMVECLGLPPEKIAVIPNGVDARFAPVPMERMAEVRHKLALPERYLLCVGSQEPRKNLAKLLAAWEQAQTQCPDHSLVMVGAKNQRTFRDLGLASLPPRVMQTGYVDHADLPAVYAAADLFVYPSLYEGFGLPVLEAMACGTPVVCSSTTSLPEVAGDAAELVDPQQVDAIAAAMVKLIDSSTQREQYRVAGLARTAAFSWDRTAELTRGILEQVALA